MSDFTAGVIVCGVAALGVVTLVQSALIGLLYYWLWKQSKDIVVLDELLAELCRAAGLGDGVVGGKNPAEVER